MHSVGSLPSFPDHQWPLVVGANCHRQRFSVLEPILIDREAHDYRSLRLSAQWNFGFRHQRGDGVLAQRRIGLKVALKIYRASRLIAEVAFIRLDPGLDIVNVKTFFADVARSY